MTASTIATSRQRGRLSPIKFEHAGLRTKRLAQMVDWYTTVLEAELAYRNEFIAFLWYDEQNHRCRRSVIGIDHSQVVPDHCSQDVLKSLENVEERQSVKVFLREMINKFVNSFRHRARLAALQRDRTLDA